jgi:ribosomal protein S18 acetylase RimI-like enzyme
VERLIRPMEARDLEPSLALWRNVEGIVLRVDSDNLEALGRFLTRNPGTSFVADEDGVLIGNILCGHDGRRGYLYHLAVVPAHRHTRCATALLNASLNALALQNITRCHAFTLARHMTSLTFWEKVNGELRQDVRVVTLMTEGL